MKRRLAIVVALLAVAAPGTARACGLCTDAVLRRQHWWVSLGLALVVALGTEAIAYALYRLATGRKTGYRRTAVHFGAGFAMVVVGFATEASGTFMAATMAVGLAVTFVRSVIADAGFGPRVVAARIALVVAIAAALMFRAYPAWTRTPRLVTLAIIAPDSWGERVQGWAEEQIVARPEVKVEIEKRIAELEKRPGPRVQDVELFRLHRLVGGDPALRGEACRRWGVTAQHEPTIEPKHGRPLPPDGLLTALCMAAR